MIKYPLYLDYAATTPLAPKVLEAMLLYLKDNFGNASSRHHAYGWLAEEAVENAKFQMVDALNCASQEIVFTSGATESINLALKGAEVEQIITFSTEHKATLDACEALRKQGKAVEILPVDKNGLPNKEDLKLVAQKAKSLISAIWVNNETGIVFPLEEIISISKETGSLLHIDATQAIGKFNLDFLNSGIDFLSFSAHKIFGPKGVGALLVKKGSKISPLIHGGGHQRGLRSGTLNVPGIVGLGEAVSLINCEEAQKFETLKSYFEKKLLQKLPFCTINGENSQRSPLISNIQFKGFDGEDLLLKLHKIAVANGSACNSASTLPSHVLKAMHQTDEEAYAGIRFSFSPQNTKEELDFALDHLFETVNQK